MRPNIKNDDLLYPDLSYKLYGIFFSVHNKHGRFLNEKSYCDAIEIKLQEKGIRYEREFRLPQVFEGEAPGRHIVDFLIEDKIIVEAKAKVRLENPDYYQLLRYLSANNIDLGILVNFRRRHLAPKRVVNSRYSR